MDGVQRQQRDPVAEVGLGGTGEPFHHGPAPLHLHMEVGLEARLSQRPQRGPAGEEDHPVPVAAEGVQRVVQGRPVGHDESRLVHARVTAPRMPGPARHHRDPRGAVGHGMGKAEALVVEVPQLPRHPGHEALEETGEGRRQLAAHQVLEDEGAEDVVPADPPEVLFELAVAALLVLADDELQRVTGAAEVLQQRAPLHGVERGEEHVRFRLHHAQVPHVVIPEELLHLVPEADPQHEHEVHPPGKDVDVLPWVLLEEADESVGVGDVGVALLVQDGRGPGVGAEVLRVPTVQGHLAGGVPPGRPMVDGGVLKVRVDQRGLAVLGKAELDAGGPVSREAGVRFRHHRLEEGQVALEPVVELRLGQEPLGLMQLLLQVHHPSSPAGAEAIHRSKPTPLSST